MASFVERLLRMAEDRSLFCVGVDPSSELLRAWGLQDNLNGLRSFDDIVVEAAASRVALLKPQSAFFERFGPDGLVELGRLSRAIRDAGALCILDCKRGDIGSTMMAYADALFGEGSAYAFDAVTISPYLGFAAARGFIDKAIARDAGVFVVVLSSNPDGRALQSARVEDGRTVSEALGDEITAYNSGQSAAVEIGPVGAVIGATLGSFATKTVERLSHSLFLAPGIGAQNATYDDLCGVFGDRVGRAIPSASRGVLGQGPAIASLARAVEQGKEQVLRLRDRFCRSV